jgi:hypothetical protein
MKDDADMENMWTFAYVGHGVSQKDEYLIINRGTGMHMTVTGDYTHNRLPGTIEPGTDTVLDHPTAGQQVTMSHKDPEHPGSRFSVIPTRNNTGTFLLVTPQILSPSRRYYVLTQGLASLRL